MFIMWTTKTAITTTTRRHWIGVLIRKHGGGRHGGVKVRRFSSYAAATNSMMTEEDNNNALSSSLSYIRSNQQQQQNVSSDEILFSVAFDNPPSHRKNNQTSKSQNKNNKNSNNNNNNQQQQTMEAIARDLLDEQSHPMGTWTDFDVRMVQRILSKIWMTTKTTTEKHHHHHHHSTITAAELLPLSFDLLERLAKEARLFYNPRLDSPKSIHKHPIVQGIHNLVSLLQTHPVLPAVEVYQRLQALQPQNEAQHTTSSHSQIMIANLLKDPQILEPLLKLSILQNPENPDVLWNAIWNNRSHDGDEESSSSIPNKSMWDTILAVTKSPIPILEQMKWVHPPDENTYSILLQRGDMGSMFTEILEYIQTETSTTSPPINEEEIKDDKPTKSFVWTKEHVSMVLSRLIHTGNMDSAIQFYIQHHARPETPNQDPKSPMLFRTLLLACRKADTTVSASQLSALWNAYRNQPDFDENEYWNLIPEFIDLVPDLEGVLETLFHPPHSSSSEDDGEEEHDQLLFSQFLKQLAKHGRLEAYAHSILSLPMANKLEFFITTLELWNSHSATTTKSPMEIFKLVESKKSNNDNNITPDKSYFQAVWKCLERFAMNCWTSNDYSSIVQNESPIAMIQDAMVRCDVTMDSEMGHNALAATLLFSACQEAASDGVFDKTVLEDMVHTMDQLGLTIYWESIWQQHVKSPQTAILLLDLMPLPDVKSFNRTLEILSEQDTGADDTTTTTMLEIFEKMHDIPPDEITYAILIGRLAATLRTLEIAESLLVAMEAQAAATQEEKQIVVPDARHYHPVIIGYLSLNSDNDKAGIILVRQIERYIRLQRPEAAPTTAILDLMLRKIMESRDLRKAHSFLMKMHSLKSANLIPEGPDVNSYRALIRAWDHKSLDIYSGNEKNAAIDELERAISGFKADSFRTVARRKTEDAANARRHTYKYDNRREMHKSRTFHSPKGSTEFSPLYAYNRTQHSEKSECNMNDHVVSDDRIMVDLEHQINTLQEQIAKGTEEMKAAVDSRQAAILGLEKEIAALETIASSQLNGVNTVSGMNQLHQVSNQNIGEKSVTTDSETVTFPRPKGRRPKNAESWDETIGAWKLRTLEVTGSIESS